MGGWAGGRRGSWIAKGGKEALGEMVREWEKGAGHLK